MNQEIITGNLTADPELRYSNSGMAICNFSIAYNHYKKDKDDEVSFFNCVAFNKTAETIAQHFKKGGKILIHGELKQSRWTTDDGQKRSKVEIIVQRFEFMGAKE